jgi:3-oxoacyl-[acyl-carrier-protein] synthase II
MTRRVVVTGLGVITPLGNTPSEFFRSLMAAHSGIRRLSAPFADQLACRIGGEVDFKSETRLPRATLIQLDRFSRFALAATAQALADSGYAATEEQSERTGVYLGTGMGGAHALEATYIDVFRERRDRVHPLTVLRAMNNAATGQISVAHRLRGPTLTFSTACSSSAIAIGEAGRAIRHGYLDAAVAGGAESLLTLGVIRAWESLQALAAEDEDDPAASCRPFSKDRTGLVLAEGAGMVVLEDLEQAEQRGAPIYAELAGYGATSDARHLTRGDTAGQQRAMALALADARLAPTDIGYINAHGTATLAGDPVESEAIKRVFGGEACRVPVSSTKSMHGHMMGAAGAVEFIVALLAMQARAVPPTAHLRVPDPECDLDYVANLGRDGVDLRAVMSNAFAFGGSNAALVAKRFS